MPKIILGFVGEIASGKGTAAKYLEEKYNAKTHKFSTPLRDLLKRLYLEINRQNMQNISTILRAEFGQDLLAKIIAQDVQNDPTPIIVVDGIRRLADIKYLKELPQFRLIYVTADMEQRYERLIKRGENEDDLRKTWEQFKIDNQAETEMEIPTVGKQANYTLNNNPDLPSLYNDLDNIIKKESF